MRELFLFYFWAFFGDGNVRGRPLCAILLLFIIVILLSITDFALMCFLLRLMEILLSVYGRLYWWTLWLIWLLPLFFNHSSSFFVFVHWVCSSALSLYNYIWVVVSGLLVLAALYNYFLSDVCFFLYFMQYVMTS